MDGGNIFPISSGTNSTTFSDEGFNITYIFVHVKIACQKESLLIKLMKHIFIMK